MDYGIFSPVGFVISSFFNIFEISRFGTQISGFFRDIFETSRSKRFDFCSEVGRSAMY